MVDLKVQILNFLKFTSYSHNRDLGMTAKQLAPFFGNDAQSFERNYLARFNRSINQKGS